MTRYASTMLRGRTEAAVLLVGGVLAGCQAQLGGSEGSDQPSDAPGMAADGAGELPLRLLTKSEYQFTVEDQLGVAFPAADAFPAEITGTSGFATVGTVSAVNVREYMLAAEGIARDVAGRLQEFALCAADAAPTDACADTLLETLGKRLLRHPLTSSDRDEFRGLYQTARSEWGASFVEANRTVVSALLQSPFFLYRWELDDTPPVLDEARGLVRLTPYQLASRLSYFLWKSAPDDELLNAAEAGILDDDAGLRTQAERLLADPKALRTISSFHLQWLHLERLASLVKNEALYPEFDEPLKAAMIHEVESFTGDVVLGNGAFGDLLTRALQPSDAPLVELYSHHADADGVPPAGARAGLLATGAFLASHADLNEGNPILRGKVIREQVLCQTLVAPPPGIPTLAELDASLPMRERLTAHVSDPECQGCHLLTDPIGYGFGNYDAIGRYQTTDRGQAVDASGMVHGLDGEDAPFQGVGELGAVLSASKTARECLVRQWHRYALGREEAAEEEGELAALLAHFESTDGVIAALLLELVVSRPFVYRAPAFGDAP